MVFLFVIAMLDEYFTLGYSLIASAEDSSLVLYAIPFVNLELCPRFLQFLTHNEHPN